jgi:hypothetical protein
LQIGRALPSELQRSIKALRVLQLRLGLFNRLVSQCLFAVKLIALLNAILGGFAAIQQLQDHPGLALMNALIFLDGLFLFIAVFEMAYKVMQKGEELQKVIWDLSERPKIPEGERRICVRSLQATPRLPMIVGELYAVEREATPCFPDFCLGSIVFLLVTF